MAHTSDPDWQKPKNRKIGHGSADTHIHTADDPGPAFLHLTRVLRSVTAIPAAESRIPT